MRSSREAIQIQKLQTIITEGCHKLKILYMHVKLLVSFYSPPEDNAKNFEKNDFKLIMPTEARHPRHILVLSISP
jgi:hypothetical protein